MSDRRALDALEIIQEQNQPRRTVVPAVLGDGTGSTVKIANRSGYHWVRLYGIQTQLVPALNRATAAVYGLQVEVAISTDRRWGRVTYQVIGLADNELLVYSPSGQPVAFDPYMQEHAASHAWSAINRGRDPADIFPRNIAVGRVYQTTPASMKCNVSPVDYLYGNGVESYLGGQTIDFTSEAPGTANKAKLAYVCIDGSDSNLAYIYSDEFDWTGYTDPLPSSARASITPGYVLLSALILCEGMTSITEANFRYEMRPLFRAVGDAIYDQLVIEDDGSGSYEEVIETDAGDYCKVIETG